VVNWPFRINKFDLIWYGAFWWTRLVTATDDRLVYGALRKTWRVAAAAIALRLLQLTRLGPVINKQSLRRSSSGNVDEPRTSEYFLVDCRTSSAANTSNSQVRIIRVCLNYSLSQISDGNGSVAWRRSPFSCTLTSMSVLLIVGPKCTLAASHTAT